LLARGQNRRTAADVSQSIYAQSIYAQSIYAQSIYARSIYFRAIYDRCLNLAICDRFASLTMSRGFGKALN
jgi:hypothetical protein